MIDHLFLSGRLILISVSYNVYHSDQLELLKIMKMIVKKQAKLVISYISNCNTISYQNKIVIIVTNVTVFNTIRYQYYHQSKHSMPQSLITSLGFNFSQGTFYLTWIISGMSLRHFSRDFLPHLNNLRDVPETLLKGHGRGKIVHVGPAVPSVGCTGGIFITSSVLVIIVVIISLDVTAVRLDLDFII